MDIVRQKSKCKFGIFGIMVFMIKIFGLIISFIMVWLRLLQPGGTRAIAAENVAGAKAIEVICSLVQTCKHHEIDIYNYFSYVLEKIVYCATDDDFQQLLPFHLKEKLLTVATGR